jgi:hypothetical protein
MAPKTLSEFLRLLLSRGRDVVASLLFLMLAAEYRVRVEIHEWKQALYTGYAWGQALTGWGL